MDDASSSPITSMNSSTTSSGTMVDWALMYIGAGMRILPLQYVRTAGVCSCGSSTCTSPAKHPSTRNGVKDASRDPAQVRKWWQTYPNANIGIATGRGLLVIDLDPRHGGTLEALNALMPLPPTAFVRTGSGGLHLYFNYDRNFRVPNSAGKLAPGIDVRGENGYVVAPPSVHICGERYRWDKRDGYAFVPEALLQLVVEKSPPLLLYNTEASGPTPPVQRKAVSNLEAASNPESVQKSSTPGSRFIPEGKRNTTLASIAGSLRSQGANEEAMFLVLQTLNKGCCQPPLTDAEVRQICKSAGNWVPDASGQFPSRTPMVVESVATLLATKFDALPWAIPGLLPEGVSLLAGKPKMGKSWLALSLAISIALGTPVLGKLPTNQGEVLYMGLEDSKPRLSSRIEQLLCGAPSPPAMVYTVSCSHLTTGGLFDIEAWMKDAVSPRLVVIDTLARVRAQNGMSNGSVYADDYATITPLKQLAEQYHVSILLIHHLRKSSASDPMDEISGSTGLTGATDCNMVLQRERGQNKAVLHVTGRDVEDQEIRLTFDGQSALWSLDTSPADESETEVLSSVRQSIITLLEQHEHALSTKEIADQLFLDYGSVTKKLSLMKKDGQIVSLKRGFYQRNQAPLLLDTSTEVVSEPKP